MTKIIAIYTIYIFNIFVPDVRIVGLTYFQYAVVLFQI